MTFPTQSNFTRVVIREVDMTQGFVSGTDAYGKTYRMMMDLHGPVIIAPSIGENWSIQRRGNDWILYQRFENGTASTSLSEMKAGDRRLEADNKLYLNGKYIVINGTDFQSLLDRIAALEAVVFP